MHRHRAVRIARHTLSSHLWRHAQSAASNRLYRFRNRFPGGQCNHPRRRLREGGYIRGINTAAILWGSAAVGCAAGARFIFEAVFVRCSFLGANTLLRPIIDRINRQPITSDSVETTYTYYTVVKHAQHKEALLLLKESLESARIPIYKIEIRAVLLPTSDDKTELDAITEYMRRHACITQAFWSASTID